MFKPSSLSPLRFKFLFLCLLIFSQSYFVSAWKKDYPAYPVSNLSDDEFSESKVLKDLINVGTIIITCMAVFYSLIAYKDANAFFILALIKMFYNLRFMKIIYPPIFHRTLDLQMSDFTSITFSRDAINKAKAVFPQGSVPPMYARYQIGSVFLINFWDTLLTILFVALLLGLVRLGEYLTKKSPRAHAVFRYLRKALQWNIFLGLIITYLDNLVMYSALEFKSPTLSSYRNVISFLTNIALNLGMIGLWIYTWVAVSKIRKESQRSSSPGAPLEVAAGVKAKWTNFHVLFKGIKQQKFIQSSFYPIYIFRIYLFYFILSYMWDVPLGAAAIFMVMTIFMLVYFIFINPFKSRSMQIQYVVQEAVLFYVSIALAVVAIDYGAGSTLEKVRPGFARLIAYSHIGVIVLGYFILVAKTFERLIKLKNKRKEAKSLQNIKHHSFRQPDIQTAMTEQQFDQFKDEYSLSSPTIKKHLGPFSPSYLPSPGGYSPETYSPETKSPDLSHRGSIVPYSINERMYDNESPIPDSDTRMTLDSTLPRPQRETVSTMVGNIDDSPTFNLQPGSPSKFPQNLVAEAKRKAQARRKYQRTSQINGKGNSFYSGSGDVSN